tara:strand:+ start:49 stop:798 length:750 start_codon:yes stop_codon:yes gene_type:complete
MSVSNEENPERPMTPPITPLPTPPMTPEQASKKRKFDDIPHTISYSSTNKNSKKETPLSPMKDWNMFYDENVATVIYQKFSGDEVTIKQQIEEEIETWVRGKEEVEVFWNTIGEIVDIHTKNIETYKKEDKNFDLESFTKDDLYAILNDYFDVDMDASMEGQKEAVLDKSNRTISEYERRETLSDVERYYKLKNNIDDIIKKYNVEKKGETTGGRRKRTKKYKSKRKQKRTSKQSKKNKKSKKVKNKRK